MPYTEEFIASLKDEPISGAIQISETAMKRRSPWSDGDYAALLEAYALTVELSLADLLPMKIDVSGLKGNKGKDCDYISSFFTSLHHECIAHAEVARSQSNLSRFDTLRNPFRASLGTAFFYEFSQGDVEKVQTLINELRELISASAHLDKDHKHRLLKRLERLQSEMHKKVSDLDRFWGLIGDAGVVLGKLGTDAKPIVDRIKEIADIVWSTQSRAEELPSGTSLPMLENKDSHGNV
jgi:hypothetical protein